MIRTRYLHWGTHSGINQYVQYLDPRDFRIDVRLVSDGDEDFPIQNHAIRQRLRRAVQKDGIPWYHLSDLMAELDAFQKCWRRKIDIVHYLDGEHSAQFLPRLPMPPGRMRPRMIATYHQPASLLATLVNEDVVARLDCVTVVAPEQVSFFEQFMDPGRIRLVLHGIDTDYFKPASRPKPETAFKCISVGHWQRDLNAVRQVAVELKSHKKIEFHIVISKRSGPRSTGLEDLPNVILYRDHLDDAAFLEQYQQSHILFLPLLQSTANNSLLEGIACGLPVVSTSLPSVQAYLPGREAILTKDNDSCQLAEAILYLARNHDIREEMGREARRRAEELDWRNIAPLYASIYSEFAGNH